MFGRGADGEYNAGQARTDGTSARDVKWVKWPKEWKKYFRMAFIEYAMGPVITRVNATALILDAG